MPLLSVATAACVNAALDVKDAGPSQEPTEDAAGPEVERSDGAQAVAVDDASGADAADADAPDAADADTPDAADASPPDASCPAINSVPVATWVGPTPLPVATGAELWLDVLGCGFTEDTSVFRIGVGGTPVYFPTTYVSPTELRAKAWHSTGMGRHMYVGARNAASDAGPSAVVDVYLMPVADIRVLSPSSLPAGSDSFTLELQSSCLFIAGSFDTGAKVYFNSTQLPEPAFTGSLGFDLWCTARLTVPASLVATAGSANITVGNPGVSPSAPAPLQITP